MRLLGLVIGAVVILGSDQLCGTRSAPLTGALGDYAGRTLRDRRPENRPWAGVRARRASIAGTADAPRAQPHRDHRGTVDAVVRRCPRAGGPELVGECRAVVEAP